ncbi:GNAT family N-acetyltransferase [Streptomyces sp. ME01-18a]|uniref:GNAT family N-acetyltransferase n=1 Tax=Streptomyces sp. ME01-18a TaxID=3028669 RepID=UPI0029AC2DC4|nr:GNAT family N-acetyltransferase [Streptomyces sp. ME01-18a]MDX3434434.1 GNAT family N-acetyltransferase [Streptomyces sp. ME01-18a]
MSRIESLAATSLGPEEEVLVPPHTNSVVIRDGGRADLDAVLSLLDGAVAWLEAKGRTEQWGSIPFSSDNARREQITEFLDRHAVRIAELDGLAVGVCTLAEETPRYVAPARERELYMHLLVTGREVRGMGVGAMLCADALTQARRREIRLLRVDCYAGDDRALVRQYESLGFMASTNFSIDREGLKPWPGQILEMRTHETEAETHTA